MSRGSNKKKKGSPRRAPDWTPYLRGKGVAPGPVTPDVEAAVEFLAGTTEQLPEVTGEVAAALCAALGADGKLDLLARCTSDGSRDLAKAARKALHAQRRRGASVPRVPSRPAAETSASTGEDPHADARAHITAPFGGGHCILLFRFRGTTDRVLHAAMADLSDVAGLRELQLYRGGAKVYRTMVTESKGKLPGASIPFGRALYLVQQAIDLTRENQGLMPEHVSTLRTMLGSRWPLAEDHPADGLDPAEVGTDDALFALWELAELRTWIPTEQTLTELTAAIAEVLDSKLVVVELQRTQRLQELVHKAVAQELDGDGLDRWAHRLRDAAWVMHENQRPEPAARLLGVRQQLLQSEKPAELVFFQQLVGRLLLGRLPPDLASGLIPGMPQAPPDESTAEADPGGVIWTPGSSNEPTGGGPGSTGGLIIPGR